MTPKQAAEQVTGFAKTNPSKPPPLPSEWKALGATIGFDPCPPERLRIYVVGDHGCGKSTFVQSRPRNLVLSYEDSARFVSNPRSNRIDRERIPDHKAYRRVWDQIVADASNPNRPFDCVTYDTVDHFLRILNLELVEKVNPKDSSGNLIQPLKWDDITEYGTSRKGGKGWSMLYDALQKDLDVLSSLGYGWMCVSHLNEKSLTRADGTDYTDIRISMPPGGTAIVCREADFIININHQFRKEAVTVPASVKTIQGKQVPIPASVRYETTETWVAEAASVRVSSTKRRIDIPDEIPLPKKDGYTAFVAAYNAAVEHERKEQD